jgi:serine/threonine-protein kinase
MLIGQHVGPFEITGEIGSGAMGTVYKGKWEKEEGKALPVALKVVALGLVGNESAMARFEREANILKQLRHPHIVRLYATGQYKKTPFIAMEYVDGESMEKILGRRGKMNWEDVVGYAKQLCEALQHAHEKGIIHRDLKPSNLMITPDGRLKLTDFGIAKDTDVTALTGANSTIGTAAYMSPEQCKGDRNLSLKSDLYSLGIVLYELVTGKKPFTADTTVEMFLKHVNEKPVRPGKLVPDLPVWLDNLIMFLLEKEKDQRPLDAATVRKLLEDVEEKVSAQQSVGAAVANARRIDRPIREETLDESDKDTARALRAPGKKRKKKRPGLRVPTWLRATLIAVGLLAIAGVTWYLLRPEGEGAAYARVKAATAPDERLEAAASFLKRFRDDADPRVAEVRDVFKSEKVRAEEDVLARRYAREVMRRNPEGYDVEAYKASMLAIDAERAGQLPQAAVQWALVRDKSPPADPAKLTDDDEVRKSVLGWVAEKRLRDIQRDVPATHNRLLKQIEDDRVNELVRTYEDPNNPERLAVRGLRLEVFPDKAKARAEWDRLAQLTEKDTDQHVWYLLATWRAADTGAGAPKEDEARAPRQKLLEERTAQLEKAWAVVKDDPEARVQRRDIRNGCRDIIALYDDESAEPIQAVVARARNLLESIPK